MLHEVCHVVHRVALKVCVGWGEGGGEVGMKGLVLLVLCKRMTDRQAAGKTPWPPVVNILTRVHLHEPPEDSHTRFSSRSPKHPHRLQPCSWMTSHDIT